MEPLRTSNRGGVHSGAADAWFISFGDLLTLLVCFFLVLTPTAGSFEGRSQTGQAVSKQIGGIGGFGTDLASNSIDRSVESGLVVPVWRSSLTRDDGTTAHEHGPAEWLSTVKGHASAGNLAVVRVCDADLEEEVVLGLAKEFKSFAESAGRVQFEVESACELWKSLDKSRHELAAEVVLVGK